MVATECRKREPLGAFLSLFNCIQENVAMMALYEVLTPLPIQFIRLENKFIVHIGAVFSFNFHNGETEPIKLALVAAKRLDLPYDKTMRLVGCEGPTKKMPIDGV